MRGENCEFCGMLPASHHKNCPIGDNDAETAFRNGQADAEEGLPIPGKLRTFTYAEAYLMGRESVRDPLIIPDDNYMPFHLTNQRKIS